VSSLKPQGQKNYTDDPDVRLMLEFQKGDQASFEKLMSKYYSRLLNFIYRYVGIREIAEDLTQEVFMKVYQNVNRYQAKAKFSTWAFTIARNVCLNELRRLKRKTVSLNETFDVGEDTVMRQVEDESLSLPHEEMAKQERAQSIKNAIATLPENQRVAVLLRRYENFSYEEIAQTMNTTVKAVKSLLSRAKVNLRNKLSYLIE